MPPASKRKGEKSKAKGDASDATSDAAGGFVSGSSKVRHTESELSSTEMDEEVKRLKPGSPLTKRAAAAALGGVDIVADVEMGGSEGTAAIVERKSRPRKKTKQVASAGVIDRLKAVTASLNDVVMVKDVAVELAKGVLEHAGRYEALLFGLIAENERLRGRLEVYEAGKAAPQQPVFKAPLPVDRGVVVAPAPVVASAPVVAPVVRKPVETWSVVVKGKKGGTPKEVVDKVVGEVAPELGVRTTRCVLLGTEQ